VKKIDVAIVGAGPAGSACAIQLAKSGLEVLLLDGGAALIRAAESLPSAANRILRHLGVMDRFLEDRHVPSCGNDSAWGSIALRSTDSIRDPDGHGWHLDRFRFDATLRDCARRAGVEVWDDARVVEWTRTAEDWNLRIQSQGATSDVVARWLVDATGRRSIIARSQGARRLAHDRLIAFVAHYREKGDVCSDVDATTLVEATESGWWYTARMPGGLRAAVYHTDAGDSSATLARTAQGFQHLLASTQHVSLRLAGHKRVSGPKALDANGSGLDHITGPGWLATGDAAIAFDPLSSQGLLDALYSGMRAGDAVIETLAGNHNAMNDYAGMMRSVFEIYTQRLASYYCLEQRWPASAFWNSRRQTG
jgi:flavin-dependent dehydrogenase